MRVGRASPHRDTQPAHAAGPLLPAPSRRISSDENAILCKPLTEFDAQKTLRSAAGRRKTRQPRRPGRSQPSRAKSTNHDGGAPGVANEAGDRSCFFHATTTRDRTKTYRMSILHSEKAARIAGHGGSLSSRLPSGYCHAMPKTLKSWSRCVGRLERWSGISPPTPRRGP